jgi:hypothetical protein
MARRRFAQQSKRGDEQQNAEDELNPFESIQQRDPGQDEDSAHDDRSEDPEQQGFPLLGHAQAEGAEHHQEDKQIVDAERELDQVPGGELQARLQPANIPQPYAEGDGQRDQQEHKNQIGSSPRRRRPRPAVEHQQVADDQDGDHNVKAYPVGYRVSFKHRLYAIGLPALARPCASNPTTARFPVCRKRRKLSAVEMSSRHISEKPVRGILSAENRPESRQPYR